VRATAAALAHWLVGQLRQLLGGAERMRVVVVLAAVLGLSGADVATVGASATELRSALHIGNTQIGLLIAVSSLVGAVASLPFGVLADRAPRTTTLAAAIVLWAAAMVWSAFAGNFDELLLARMFLGGVTAAAGPMVASLVGDYFAAGERGRIYGFVLAGELVGAGIGYAVTGDIAALSWRAAFVALALPALVLAWFVFRLREPERGGSAALPAEGERAPAEDEAPGPTDAQRLAQKRGVTPEAGVDFGDDPEKMNLFEAARVVLRVRTNVVLIAASACGYYFLAGVQTFGIEFSDKQYGVGQALANLLLLVVGGGAVVGVLIGGQIGDALVRRGHLNGRIWVSVGAAGASAVVFVPAVLTRSATVAVPYLIIAALLLSAQNPPLDAARLDIMPAVLWGRAESIRTLLRSIAVAVAPVLFGAVSEYVFGGGRSGLKWTFLVMLLPLGASAVLLFRGLSTYPGDVAAAAEATERFMERERRGEAS
jgi:MFS family permease